MALSNVFSSLECYISEEADTIHCLNSDCSLSELVRKGGGIVQSFISNDINIIIACKSEYSKLINILPTWNSISIVSPKWVIDSYANNTLLPFEMYSISPYSLFSECFFMIITNNLNSITALEDAITHFGGTVLFTLTPYTTHIILADDISESNSFKGLTSQNIEIIHENDIWNLISTNTQIQPKWNTQPSLSILSPNTSATSFSLNTFSFNPQLSLENTLFILFINHPQERSIIKNALLSHKAKVIEISHSVITSALYKIQNSRDPCYLVSEFQNDLLSLFCSFSSHIYQVTPQWIIETIIKGDIQPFSFFSFPPSHLCFNGLRIRLFCKENWNEYKQLLDSCDAYVLLTSRSIQNERVIADCLESVPADIQTQYSHSIVSIQWIHSCYENHRILPFSSFLL